VLDSIRALAARTPPGTWIQTTIGPRMLNDPAARRAALDSAAPHHPVLLWTWWGHGAVANGRALRMLVASAAELSNGESGP
jgi:predicted amidohydrolase YtcJ